MSDKRVIAILGATGQQGGAVFRALQEEPQRSQFTTRVILRNEAKRKDFERQSCQVVIADLEDMEGLCEAFQEAYGLYAVTPRTFGETACDQELKIGKNIAQAASKAKVQHVVWATKEDTRKIIPTDSVTIPTLFGKYKCPQCDVKAEIDLEFRKLGVPTSFLLLSGFFENFLTFSAPKRNKKTGRAYLASVAPADLVLVMHTIDDIGKAAAGIFSQGESAMDTYFTIGVHTTMGKVTSTFAKVFNEPFDYVAQSPNQLRDLNFPGATTLANFFQYMDEFSEDNLKLHPNNPLCLDFESWLVRNKDRIKIIDEE